MKPLSLRMFPGASTSVSDTAWTHRSCTCTDAAQMSSFCSSAQTLLRCLQMHHHPCSKVTSGVCSSFTLCLGKLKRDNILDHLIKFVRNSCSIWRKAIFRKRKKNTKKKQKIKSGKYFKEKVVPRWVSWIRKEENSSIYYWQRALIHLRSQTSAGALSGDASGRGPFLITWFPNWEKKLVSSFQGIKRSWK